MVQVSFKDCEKILQRHLSNEKFKLVNYEDERQSDRLKIKMDVKVNDDLRQIGFFGKEFSGCERNCVGTLLEFYERFDLDNVFPKMYPCKDGLVIFEDLTMSGYIKKGLLDLEHIHLVLNALAKLHAASIIFEENNGRPIFDSFYEESLTIAENQIEEFVDLVPDFKWNFSHTKKSCNDKLRKVFSHGNVCAQNVMFQYKNGVPISCRLINLERQRYLPPAYDVLYLIYHSTDTNTRQKQLRRLIRHYYDALDVELSKEGLDVENMLLFDDLKMSINEILLTIKLEVALNFSKQLKVEDSNEIKRRLTEILIEINELSTCPKLSREDCAEIIKRKLGITEYKLVQFTLTPIDEVSGFLGAYFKLKIELLVENNLQVFNLFVKAMPVSQSQIDLVQGANCLEKEIFFYETIVPKIKKAGVDCIEECVAPSYLAKSQELIVFEDMNCQNYRSMSPRKPFDYQLLTIVVKKLAKFHASSLIFEERSNLRINEKFGAAVVERVFVKDENHSAKLMEIGRQTIPHIIDLLYPSMPKDAKEQFKKKAWDVSEIFYELAKPSTRFRNVLCEGDLWASNILVAHVDDRPVDCRFVDFQHARYCPPSHDLLSVLYLTTDRNTRKKCMSILLDEYYEMFGNVLKEHDVDVDSIYPYKTFIESCEHLKPQVVFQSCLLLQFITCNSDAIKKITGDEEASNFVFFVDRKDFIKNMCEECPIYKQRLSDAIQDLKDVCDSIF